MKNKILLLLTSLVTLLMSGCSWFDSDPIEPEIIGIGHVKLNPQNNLYVVELDSISYIVDKVVELDRSPRSVSKTQELPPVDGMEVTVFKDKNDHVIYVYGRRNEAQIEELYHTNSTLVFVFAFVVLIFFVLCFAQAVRSDIKASRDNDTPPQS